MSRYSAITISLGLLATLYWALGGFDGSSPSRSVGDPGGQDFASTPEAIDPAAGGPDDGPSLGMQPLEPGFASLSVDSEIPAADVEDWEDVVIGRRESFYVALRRVGLEHETIMDVVETSSAHTDLKKVKRGDHFLLSRQEESFRALRFDLDRERYLVIEDTGEGLAATVARYPIDETVRAVRGRIETNLFEALLEQGADPTVADQMAEILGWDIDFFRDRRCWPFASTTEGRSTVPTATTTSTTYRPTTGPTASRSSGSSYGLP